MNLKEVDLRKVYRVWKKNLGEYRCFFRSTPFVSLKNYEDFILNNYKSEVNEILINTVVKEYEEKYFTIVDLDFNKIVDLAIVFNNKFNIKPILNINLMFNDFGIVGNKENISKLINGGKFLEDKKCNKYIMMIPYDRFNEDIDVNKINDKLNNQYAVGFDDLPDEEFLKALGYRGIKIITRQKVKEDLVDYINFMKDKIEVKIVKVE